MIAALALLLAVQTERPQAPWPPPPGPLRVVIDTDAACEVDDHYALALALGFPERITIEGFVAAHFARPDHIEKSFKDIELVLAKAGMTGKYPVKRGAPPMKSPEDRPSAEGVDFIIERAKAGTPENPLWLVLLGPATDAVLALEKDPSIADRLIVFWHGRSEWPKKCLNFNAKNDRFAARRIFEQPSRYVLFDTGAQLGISMEETAARLAPIHPLGTHLLDIRWRSKGWQGKNKGMFDLGDIAALIDPACAPWERTAAPSVLEDMSYDFTKTHGELVRIKDVDRERSFALLEEALRKLPKAK
ncbi:MAG TPA: nucleoside hydrolase [Planctomycetota bacterium]|nr:nucleoside hydrolase [Planctomycetota bacterium]